MTGRNIKKKEVQCEIKEPSIEYKDSYLSALQEYKREGIALSEKDEGAKIDFDGFLKRLKDESLDTNIKPGHVPETTYWIIDKDGFVGRISLRHVLNDNLLKIGGHIGYDIRPSKRGFGYGERALELVLPKARAMGLDRVLITYDNMNMVSRKIIEANGGVLEDEIPAENGNPGKLKFRL